MRRNLLHFGQRLVVALLLALGLSSSGCSDSVSVSEDVSVPLASLVITPGTLQPGFFSNTTSYKVNAPTSADSVTVTATPRSSTVEMTINGVVTASGQGRTISLGTPGSITTITIVLFSQTGSETTYTINVTRLLSSDDTLKDLRVTSGTLKPNPFSADTLDYEVDIPSTVGQVTVTATKSDKDATMVIRSAVSSVTVGPGPNPEGQLPVTLGSPGTSTLVTIEVTAPNGSKETYQLTINRLSSDNNLSALSLAAGSTPLDLVPIFTPSHRDYTVEAPAGVLDVTVTATKSDPNAVLSGSVPDPGTGGVPGQATIPFTSLPPPQVSITVTAPDGSSQTYTVTVNQAASSDNNLSALSLAAGSTPLDLVPIFTPSHRDYTVEAPAGVLDVTVTATKSDPNAVLSGSVPDPGTGGVPGQATIPFTSLPPPQVSITVTAPDGSSQTYTVTVNRAPASPVP